LEKRLGLINRHFEQLAVRGLQYGDPPQFCFDLRKPRSRDLFGEDRFQTSDQSGKIFLDAYANSPERELALVWDMFFGKKYDAALEAAQRLLEQNPHSGELHYLIALSHHEIGSDCMKAHQHYSEAIKFGFDNAWVRYHRGRVRLDIGDKMGRADLEIARSLRGEAGDLAGVLLNKIDQSL
jgi:tetratricopeptide (TPR) repeat protein